MSEKMVRTFPKSIDNIVGGIVFSGIPQANAKQKAEVYSVLQSYIPVLGVERACEYVCSIVKFGFAVADENGYNRNDFFAVLIKSMRDIYRHDIAPSCDPGFKASKALGILQDRLNALIDPGYRHFFPEK